MHPLQKTYRAPANQDRGRVFARCAFTLVELLVVIGIISVLISILLPTLAGARKNAQKVQCLSNLRQIGMAFQTYAADNKGSYPVASAWNVMGKVGTQRLGGSPYYDDQNGSTGWVGDRNISTSAYNDGIRPLNKYLVNKEVVHCPADSGDPRGDVASIGYQVSCYDSYGTSYFVQWQESFFGVRYVTADPSNPFSIKYVDPPLPHTPMKSGQFKNASRKIIASDWNWSKNRHIDEPTTMWHHKFVKNSIPGVNAQRYMNIVFADGHAEDFAFPLWYESLNDGGTDAPASVPGQTQTPGGLKNVPDPNREFW
jgi:prepilin-type N-terminal cleavage/methylation domain-containing protein/prepilin-type processing-associated H-X9-DG protein